ncbi:hypothetical protein L6164_011229 [Bauhinia variegata]|uniref:Uncharacterized protein n=1 Tax=Bauhinia variegata TaxID=167791 RepID=A0ACB9P6F6_BAUVA|nr:hypothetical protein L6164_011229 [Bauhinia variegata]
MQCNHPHRGPGIKQAFFRFTAISSLCEATGAEISQVSHAFSKNIKIGSKFLNLSGGFGGSCFQKDILNLVYISECNGLIEETNYWKQVTKVSSSGFAFKKDTCDTRKTRANVCEGLLGDEER